MEGVHQRWKESQVMSSGLPQLADSTLLLLKLWFGDAMLKHNLKATFCIMLVVTVDLYPCQHLETLEKGRGNPMYLGLKEVQSSLFCTKVGEQPELQLNVSMEKKVLLMPDWKRGVSLFTRCYLVEILTVESFKRQSVH